MCACVLEKTAANWWGNNLPVSLHTQSSRHAYCDVYSVASLGCKYRLQSSADGFFCIACEAIKLVSVRAIMCYCCGICVCVCVWLRSDGKCAY